MASLTRWTWVWASSGSWWWTGKPSMLQSMGSQRVRHDWVTELNWYMHIIIGATDSGHLLCGKYLLYTPKPYSIVKTSTKSDPISIRKSLTLFFNSRQRVSTFSLRQKSHFWGRLCGCGLLSGWCHDAGYCSQFSVSHYGPIPFAPTGSPSGMVCSLRITKRCRRWGY